MSLFLLVTSPLLISLPAPAVETDPSWLSPKPLFSSQEMQRHDDDHRSDTGNNFYLRLTGGLVTTKRSDGPDNDDIEFDEGYLISLGFGHRFGANTTGFGFAVELDGVWTDQDADDSEAVRDLSVAGALVNGIVDYRLADQFTIYGAGGIGAAWLEAGTRSDGDFDDEDGPFLAWQLKAGVAWSFTDDLALHFGYRFLNIDDAEFDSSVNSSFDLETRQHVLELGLIFGF